MAFGVTVNLVSVFWAAVVSFIFGFLWYSPTLFGKTWMKLSGIKAPKKKEKSDGMKKAMILSFIGSLVTAYVISMFIPLLGVSGFSGAIELGFFLWLGFMGSTTLLGSVLWDMKPWGLWILNSVYWFLNLSLMTPVILYL